MKKILCFGDSITDMRRTREEAATPFLLGAGYPFLLEERIGRDCPGSFEIINRGISGNRSVDAYARLKEDVWNLEPDVMVILLGINDIWHELGRNAGVDLKRFRKVYSAMVEETKEKLPNIKMVLVEPFVLHGVATDEHFDWFSQAYDYAKAVEDIAKEEGCVFVPLQKQMDDIASKNGPAYLLYDGVHPTIQGSRVIADVVYDALKRTLEI